MNIKILDLSPFGPVYHATVSDEAYASGVQEWGEDGFMEIVRESVLSKADWDLAKISEPSNPEKTYRRIKAVRRGWAVEE